ncbi:FAD-binding protein [Actinophytocola oryzae]|uniref:Electron transfer flavoprotein alpha subunit apoprotein /electron transfer flavoprotein beta subunit n=1 Tax=Actinophytocola oryzae TaxID=502181 RepID=A0A4R7VL91_9PSEU|nr:FAD-binding protein [Actinophytocola oryzae]TDV49969.1 electron transfer flavoprotein alpha subunit apoprotein /electron transfer flavoprotein beta subunit [Actinophytocola oryzae]
MTALRTIALVKQVPRGDLALGADGRLARDGLVAEMNPWCRRAVTVAVRFGRAAVITMGPPSAVDVALEAAACGVEETVHLCDPRLAGADCLVTARALAAAVTRLGPADLVLVGRSSIDGSTGAVGAMVAELLGLPFTGPALTLDLDGRRLSATLQHDGRTEDVTITLPAVVAVAERSCEPAKAGQDTWPAEDTVTRWTMDDLDPALPTGRQSPTAVTGVRPVTRTRQRLVLHGDPAEQAKKALEALAVTDRPPTVALPVPAAHRLTAGDDAVLVVSSGHDRSATRALLGEAAALAAGPVVLVCPGIGSADAGRWGADEILDLTAHEPRPVAAALAESFRHSGPPWAVLGGSGSWERETLARLAVRLDAGIMSDLLAVESANGTLTGLKPVGDGGLAEITGLGATRIATLRTGNLEPRADRPPGTVPRRELVVPADPAIERGGQVVEDDYDALDRATAVIAVGRGVDPAEYGRLEPLAALLGAEMAATRKVTDAGWLPHSRQIGITARNIAPDLYVAIGLAGNMNHLAGAGRAGTILAINTDPDAPVFAASDVGIVGDWREVVPALVTELRHAAAR